jgi:hypothetical protein
VRERNLIPAQVLAEAGTRDPVLLTELGVGAVQEERWQRALILLAEAYRLFSSEPAVKEGGRIESGEQESVERFEARMKMFSHYGLALAMSDHSRAPEGARFCEIAIQKEPDRAEHYALLARVWRAGRNRLKTVQAIDRGLRDAGYDRLLMALRTEIGWRKKKVLGFLPRSHPVNVTIGKILRKSSTPASEDEPPPRRPKR